MINNIKTVATFGREEAFLREYNKILPVIRKKNTKKGYKIGVAMGLSSLFLFFSFALLFFVGSIVQKERVMEERIRD